MTTTNIFRPISRVVPRNLRLICPKVTYSALFSRTNGNFENIERQR